MSFSVPSTGICSTPGPLKNDPADPKECEVRFQKTFEQVKKEFSKTFRQLFNGGTGAAPGGVRRGRN